ncbi:hypothetical protein BU17DRAFT_81691 [Hysterangium stoloniferum]|nr:hypothetical protein BU17DRAFT_81691 [Hysterangium stoloniferum]
MNNPPEYDLTSKMLTGRKGLPKYTPILTKTDQDKTTPLSAKASKRIGIVSSSHLSSSPEGRADLMLPIKTLLLGNRILDTTAMARGPDLESEDCEYWFRVRGKNVSIIHGSRLLGTSLFEYELGPDIKSVELPETPDDALKYAVIILTLCVTARTSAFIDKTEGIDCKRPIVAMKLLTVHSHWSLEVYKGIESLLTGVKGLEIHPFNAGTLRMRWLSSQAKQAPSNMKSVQTPQSRPRPRPTSSGHKYKDTQSSGNFQSKYTSRHDLTPLRGIGVSSTMPAASDNARSGDHDPFIDMAEDVSLPRQKEMEFTRPNHRRGGQIPPCQDLPDKKSTAAAGNNTSDVAACSSSVDELTLISQRLSESNREIREKLQQGDWETTKRAQRKIVL